MNKIIVLILGVLFSNLYSQNIRMEFPYFKGKTYDFIIFQGSGTKMVVQGTIPADGKFTLSIPKEYAPYTGMSRWLITGTQEGGGLDMLIPGHDFSVSCKDAKPDNSNIIYKGSEEIQELNRLYKKQQGIFSKHDAMFQAIKAFPKEDKNYPLFEKEYQNQLKAYEDFQEELRKKGDYPAGFTNIVNITQGIGTRILSSEEDKAKNIADYMAKEMDWQMLYTSGHWSGVISSWVAIHTEVFNDPDTFAAAFAEIDKKIKNTEQYNDFAGRVAYSLTQNGKDNFIKVIAPLVVASGKIRSYEGALAVYVSAKEGTQAPDLDLVASGYAVLKSRDFSKGKYNKTLLLFYKSDCGSCEQVLDELTGKYELLKSAGIRVISIAADKQEEAFKSKAKEFPWKDTYCDYEGEKGINFKNYGVSGTPTIFLISKAGKVLRKTAALIELLDELKNTR
ncbi:thioredoxin family protein [Chryseobacterium sp. MA9]|uniref:TlpA family protein disulfide reductase n=1 Tax=Chryseobacterium sp. MA9 TaxID=2966625 RepID=UPI0021071757|nr:thioredoxin family protein [Chryseobacterium sp. MA9]UTX48889.1 thioredoxin family protein [Chryseobacterium sp. MA9]